MLINIFFFTIFLLIIVLISISVTFKHETYYKITGNSFFKTVFDIGKHGEYLTYKKLKNYETDGGQFLFNCYLPKEDGKTTEIDVLLIHSTGIFVIESKNYSGWIYGSENNKTWTQTLRSGNGKIRKEHFYNPIMQNSTHVKWLKEIVGTNIPIYSVIAFSERCTLKDIPVESSDVVVINRQDIGESVKRMGNRSIQALSKMDISRIQEMLYPYTQTTDYEKQHRKTLRTRISTGSVPDVVRNWFFVLQKRESIPGSSFMAAQDSRNAGIRLIISANKYFPIFSFIQKRKCSAPVPQKRSHLPLYRSQAPL